MFSVDYIHKSQDAQSWNLVNFKNCKGYCVRLMLYPIAWAHAYLYNGFTRPSALDSAWVSCFFNKL